MFSVSFLLLLSKFFVLTFGNLVLMFYCVVFFGLILLWLTGFLEYGCAISYVPWRHFQSLYFHISFLTQNFSQFPPPGTHVICVFVQLMMPYKSLEFLCFSSFYFLSVPLIELFQMTCIRIHWFFLLLDQAYSWIPLEIFFSSITIFFSSVWLF